VGVGVIPSLTDANVLIVTCAVPLFVVGMAAARRRWRR